MRTTPKMGLTSWDQLSDNYNYAQLAGNWQLVDYHDHSPGRGVQIPAGGLGSGSVLSQNIAASQVGLQHLALPVVQDLGLSAGGYSGRGAVSIPTQQTQAGGGYALLGTPDSVTVTLQTNGLIFITYLALWKASSGTAAATIFIGSNQLSTPALNGAPTTVVANTTQTHFQPLYTQAPGLVTLTSNTSDSTEVTTGEVVPGTIAVFAAAGTYTVSVQYSQSVVQNRHLWVWVMNF